MDIYDMSSVFRDVSRRTILPVVAVNCYQHAIGLKAISMTPFSWDGDKTSLALHRLIPGFSTGSEAEISDDFELYKQQIIQGCLQDGLLDQGHEMPESQDGYRAVAVFFSETRKDFHFSFLNDEGQWESKCPLSLPETQTKLTPPYSYEFDRFMLAPHTLDMADPKPHAKKYRHIFEGGRDYSLKFIGYDQKPVRPFVLEYNPRADVTCVKYNAHSTAIVPRITLPIDHAVGLELDL